jgi:hypothetical protein
MKKFSTLLLLTGLIMPLGASPGQVLFTAKLDGATEAPPVVTTGKGSAWAVLSADMKTLTYRMTYARLGAARTGAHFHAGGTGGGAIVQPLTFSGNTVSGTWTSLPDSIVRHLMKGDIYLNIHTSTNPGGEIRGYLQVAQGVGFTVAMDGSQESPPTPSTAQGTGWVVLDSVGARLTYDVTVAGLNAALSAGHFHALPSGGIVKPITFVDSTSDGVWSAIPDSILTSLTNGRLYVNVHTQPYPGGEIRGGVRYGTGVATGVEVVSQNVPSLFKLEQNYPNPFNPSTKIRFQLDKASSVTLKIYNLIGQEVASLVEGTKQPGTYDVLFDARALSSGVYFYRLSTAAGPTETRKMVLLK